MWARPDPPGESEGAARGPSASPSLCLHLPTSDPGRHVDEVPFSPAAPVTLAGPGSVPRPPCAFPRAEPAPRAEDRACPFFVAVPLLCWAGGPPPGLHVCEASELPSARPEPGRCRAGQGAAPGAAGRLRSPRLRGRDTNTRGPSPGLRGRRHPLPPASPTSVPSRPFHLLCDRLRSTVPAAEPSPRPRSGWALAL